MASLRVWLGLYPKTSKVEADWAALEKEYADLNALLASKEYAEYASLEKVVPTPSFKDSLKRVRSLKYKGSNEYLKEKEYHKLVKEREIKDYLSLVNSAELKDFIDFESSKDYQQFQELERQINRGDKAINREFKTLKKSFWFAKNLKFKVSSRYKNYLNIVGSTRLKRLEELKTLIGGEGFIKAKAYLQLSPRQKMEQSKEYKQLQRFNELKNSSIFKWYFTIKNSTKFNLIKRMTLTFEDDFTASKPDPKKWVTKYLWGENILQDSYSTQGEKQMLTDGKNIETGNSILRIVTKREQVIGKMWNPEFGFMPREYDFTSGIISTGNSFRQKYGIFEAKVKFPKSYPVQHAFWMLADTSLPHIDVARTNKKLRMTSLWGEGGATRAKSFKVGLNKLTSDFFIYRLEWTHSALIWKINGLTVDICTEGVPDVPMYVLFSSTILDNPNGLSLPVSMDIDWVRCYEVEGF